MCDDCRHKLDVTQPHPTLIFIFHATAALAVDTLHYSKKEKKAPHVQQGCTNTALRIAMALCGSLAVTVSGEV